MRRSLAFLWIAVLGCGTCTPLPSRVPDASAPPSPNPAAYRVGELLFADSFANLDHWKPELESGGTVNVKDGLLEMDVPKGCTVWLMRELAGPVMIEYQARMIQATPAGPNDRVSDLNCFWMASDPRALSDRAPDFFSVADRTGAFASYNRLLTYYVGQGGNSNTTTRFRRYIGDATNRPLLPEHDLTAKEFLLTPNVWQRITLVASGGLIEYYRDGRRIFQYRDPAPYTKGYFGLRTTQNHMQVRDLKIYRLIPA